MSASPKSKRTPPSNKFEDYVLTYEVGQETGLFPVSSANMTYTQYASLPGESGQEDYLDIGFTFKFDNREYTRIYVNGFGFAILIDPSSNPDYVVDGTLGGPAYNSSIIDDVWGDANVVLAPWWDSTRTSWRNTRDTAAGGEEAAKYLDVLGISLHDAETGLKKLPSGIDGSLGGLKYCNGSSSENGRYFVIRWKSFSRSDTSSYNVITYDLVLYESGRIEFRYAPCDFRRVDVYENATVGIFAYGGSNYSPRYRDFGYLLKSDLKGRESDSFLARKKYVNGGAVYNKQFIRGNEVGYTDTDRELNTAKYTITLNTYSSWPGLNRYGAVFRFSPPANRRRQNKSVTTLRDSTSFTEWNSSLFNDQNSIFIPRGVKTNVEYPSMLPSSHKIENNTSDAVSIVETYRSGSIVVNRETRPGLFDDVLSDAVIDGRKRK